MNKAFAILCLSAAFAFAKPVVTTSILPTKYFVEQIAGDTVEINTMVSPGADPHTYEPRPEQMKMLEKSDIFFSIGMEYENVWLPKFMKSYPNLNIVKTQKGIPLMASDHHHCDHGHHHHADHKHNHHHADHKHKHDHHSHKGEHKHKHVDHYKDGRHHCDHDHHHHHVDHKHEHKHEHKHSYYGIFEDKEVKDRDLSDWYGEFKSIYSYVGDGTLDPFFKAKAAAPNSTKNPDEYKAYYEKGYKSDIEKIVIEKDTMSFYKKDGVVTGKYAYKGYEILTYENGGKGARYQFENIDKNSKAPKFIQFSDHEISPTKISHFHIYMGNESFKALLSELENWPTFYKSSMSKDEIVDDMIDHIQTTFDTHIWLDPVLVKTQAKNIVAALITHYPKNKAVYEANLAKFENKLNELDKHIKDQLSGIKNRNFIVYHPSWAYFAKRYDLNQISIEVEGKEPKPAALAELIKEAKEQKAKVIFVAPQFSKKSAEVIAKEVGANVVEIDPLPENWLENMQDITKAFKEAL